MRIFLTNNLLRRACYVAGHGWPYEGRLHAFGIRGAKLAHASPRTVPSEGRMAPIASAPVIEPSGNQPGLYDDVIGTFGTVLLVFPGSTDPGLRWSRKPMNPEGCAHLMPGAWEYRLGKHKGITALVQHGDVRVRRDSDRDGSAEAGEPVRSGQFGINIHPGGADGSDDSPGKDEVGSWSAGCQVIAGGEDGANWQGFIRRFELSGATRFKYYLLEYEIVKKAMVDGTVRPQTVR